MTLASFVLRFGIQTDGGQDEDQDRVCCTRDDGAAWPCCGAGLPWWCYARKYNSDVLRRGHHDRSRFRDLRPDRIGLTVFWVGRLPTHFSQCLNGWRVHDGRLGSVCCTWCRRHRLFDRHRQDGIPPSVSFIEIRITNPLCAKTQLPQRTHQRQRRK